MDTSSRFTSSRLRIIKGEMRIRQYLTPRELAQLIFDEIKGMDYHLFDALFRKDETGIPIGINGRRTISYRSLGIQSDTVIFLGTSSQPLVYDNRNTHAKHPDEEYSDIRTWGLLLVHHEERSLRWIVCNEFGKIEHDSQLDPEALTELMSTDKAPLNGVGVYGKLMELVTRRSKHYTALSSRLLVYAVGLDNRYRQLNAPYWH